MARETITAQDVWSAIVPSEMPSPGAPLQDFLMKFQIFAEIHQQNPVILSFGNTQALLVNIFSGMTDTIIALQALFLRPEMRGEFVLSRIYTATRLDMQQVLAARV